MSNQHRKQRQRNRGRAAERRLWIRAVRRDTVDMRKLGRAILELAAAEAERRAQAEHRAAHADASGPTVATEYGQEDGHDAAR